MPTESGTVTGGERAERESKVSHADEARPDPAARTRAGWHTLTLDSRAALVLAFCFFALVVVRRAWVSDDAFISLRVAHNWVLGFGLTHNPGERVQGFTNPLWVMLLAAVYAVMKNGYGAAIVTSLVVAVASGLVFARFVARDRLAAALGLAAMALSNAYADFSTSGLENPLSHLLLFGLLATYFALAEGSRAESPPARRAPVESGAHRLPASLPARLPSRTTAFFLAALLMLNRPDTVVLAAPVLAHLAWRGPWRKTLREAALGFAPLAAWALFALVYYGFLQPNTAISKLNSSIPREELLGQGLVYLLDALQRDPLTPTVIALGVALGLTRRNRAALFVAIGIALHLAYVVWVGGDFMAGRFLTLPFAAALALLSSRLFAIEERGPIVVAAAAVGTLAFLSPYNPFRDGIRPKDLPASGIVSEREWFMEQTGLVVNLRRPEYRNHSWWIEGKKARDGADPIAVHANAGLFGYAAGPERHVVDLAGLTDPLLSRIRFVYIPHWRPGHLGRQIPAGYLETLRTGNNVIEDPHLRAYYTELRQVVRGPVWSLPRFRKIIELNLGKYDGELAAAAPPK